MCRGSKILMLRKELSRKRKKRGDGKLQTFVEDGKKRWLISERERKREKEC